MNPRVEAYLQDVKNAIEEIESFLPQEKNYHFFVKDLKGRRAVERNIEIVGEAINRILNLEPSIEITDSRKIVDTRNRIIHGYDSVSSDILWLIVIKYLPVLKNEVDVLLGSSISETGDR